MFFSKVKLYVQIQRSQQTTLVGWTIRYVLTMMYILQSHRNVSTIMCYRGQMDLVTGKHIVPTLIVRTIDMSGIIYSYVCIYIVINVYFSKSEPFLLLYS